MFFTSALFNFTENTKEMVICCTPGHTHQNQAIMLISKKYSIVGFSCKLVNNFVPFHSYSNANPRWLDCQFLKTTNFAQAAQLKSYYYGFLLRILPEDNLDAFYT